MLKIGIIGAGHISKYHINAYKKNDNCVIKAIADLIDSFFQILRKVCSLDEAMDNIVASNNMTDTVEQVFRLIFILRNELNLK